MPLDSGSKSYDSGLAYQGLQRGQDGQVVAHFTGAIAAQVSGSVNFESAEIDRIARKSARDEAGMKVASEGIYVADAQTAKADFAAYEAGEISLDDIPVAEAKPIELVYQN